jgi:hypothetical protein
MLCKWGLCTITVACKQHLLCYVIGGPSSGLVPSSFSIGHLARSFLKTHSKFKKKIIPPKTNSQNSAKLNKENISTQNKLS